MYAGVGLAVLRSSRYTVLENDMTVNALRVLLTKSEIGTLGNDDLHYL